MLLESPAMKWLFAKSLRWNLCLMCSHTTSRCPTTNKHKQTNQDITWHSHLHIIIHCKWWPQRMFWEGGRKFNCTFIAVCLNMYVIAQRLCIYQCDSYAPPPNGCVFISVTPMHPRPAYPRNSDRIPAFIFHCQNITKIVLAAMLQHKRL